MATSETIKIPFAEKVLTANIKEHHNPGVELFLYDRGGAKSVGGLVLWVDGQGNQTYQVLKKIAGRKYRRNLGTRQGLSVEQARDAAGALIQQLKEGKDPKLESTRRKALQSLRGLTYEKALEEFLDEAELAETTATKYRQSVHTFADCKTKPLSWFTEARVREIHAKRSQKSKACADHDMRVLRLLWNWAGEKYKSDDGNNLLGPHPVAVLNKKQAGRKGWNTVPRKQTIIPKAKLPDWFGALYQIRDEPDTQRARRVGCLLLEALVLTGLRFKELATLPRTQIEAQHGLITIPDSTSKNRQSLLRPITKRVGEILQELPRESDFIFPGRNRSNPAPLNNTIKLQEEIRRRTGLWITPHDLRRVWASAASRAGLPQLVTKRLLNHVSHTQEVTEGYQVLGLDELLDYSQQVENQILRDAGLLQADPDELFANLTPEQKQRLFELARQEVGL